MQVLEMKEKRNVKEREIERFDDYFSDYFFHFFEVLG